MGLGVPKAKHFKGISGVERGGDHIKNPFVGRVWILSGKRHSAICTECTSLLTGFGLIHDQSFTFNIQVISLIKIRLFYLIIS